MAGSPSRAPISSIVLRFLAARLRLRPHLPNSEHIWYARKVLCTWLWRRTFFHFFGMALFLSSDMGEDDKAVVVKKILILCGREWLKSDSFSNGWVGESFLFVDRIRLSADRIRLSTGAIRMPTDSLIVFTHSFVRKNGKYAPKFQRKGENGEF